MGEGRYQGKKEVSVYDIWFFVRFGHSLLPVRLIRWVPVISMLSILSNLSTRAEVIVDAIDSINDRYQRQLCNDVLPCVRMPCSTFHSTSFVPLSRDIIYQVLLLSVSF